MTRKDAVIIASLVNGAVLALLMILAVDVEEPKSDKLATSRLVKMEPKREEVILKAKEIKREELFDKGDAIVQAHLEEKKQIAAAPKEEIPLVKPKGDEEWYTVKSGDNPWKIAKSEKIDYDDILKLNQMTESKAKNLKPGDRIRIR
jgi:LysM domain.